MKQGNTVKGWLSRHFRGAVTAGVAMLAVTAAGASAAALSGGGPATLGPGASTSALTGQVSQIELMKSLPFEHTTINASALRPGASYAFNNVSVTIIGNLPAGDTLTGTDSQLFLTGKMGSHTTIDMTTAPFKGSVAVVIENGQLTNPGNGGRMQTFVFGPPKT